MYDKALVELLRSSKRTGGEQKVLTNDEILTRLNIEATEAEAIKGLYNQLQHLEEFGLVKLTQRGWKWL
jgi:hypothetical protein